MATANIRCPDVSWSYHDFFSTNGLVIQGARDNQALVSVTLWCTKFTNYGYPIIFPTKTVPAGATTSTNTVTLRLRVNGVYSNEAHTITGITPIRGGNHYNDSWAPASDSYTFTFPSNVPISSSSNIIRCEISGVYSYGCGLSIWRTSSSQGYAEIIDIPQGPSSISVSPVAGDDGWITDLSGATRNSSQGVLKDYICRYNLTPNPSNAEITQVNFSGNSYSDCSYSGGIITARARNNNTDYPTRDNVTVSVNGGASTTFPVYFYEKPKANLSGTNTIELNIRTAGNQGFSLSGYGPATINSESDRALFLDGAYQQSFSLQNSNTLLNAGQYLTTTSDSSNLFKISGENSRHNVTWRFFNHFVQTNTSSVGTYKRDLDTYVTWYITPNYISQFSFDWLDVNNNIVTDLPDVIIPEFDSPIIGNLKYTNAAIAGGYCRGFRIEYIKEDGTVVRSDYLNANIDGSGVASTNGRILDKNNLDGLPHNELLTIKITMYFYFDDSTTTRYFGASYVLEQKLLNIKEEDLYPTLVFPIVNQQSPYSPMMLTEVERFGYEMSDIVINRGTLFDVYFGLLVNNEEVNFDTAPDYISSNKLTKHLVYDIGKYVEDKKLYLDELTILPYIDVYYGKKYVKRVTVKYDKATTPNATIVTTLESMWNRPTVDKGEYVTYFDYDRFMQFINKYRMLYNNQLFNVPINMQGAIINTDFWVDKANTLDIYATNMQNWATDTTNFVILWALPEFKHKKGEIITNNNLYQNYYDLLIQHSGRDAFATHDYLNENKYTHDELGKYTHDQITNKEM